MVRPGSQAEALANAPERSGEYVVVPAIMGGRATARVTADRALTRLHAHEMAAACVPASTSARAARCPLELIAGQDRALNAWVSVDPERAATPSGGRRAPRRGPREGPDAVAALPPLLGIPVALKDLVARGRPSTAGVGILAGFIGPYDAHIAERLDAAGAVIAGKTNMDEFAMGSSTEHSAYGPTANPWDLDRVPGGSSGGSAAAVAAFHVPLAIGTDTGGLDPAARGADRHRGHQAHVRPRQPLRHHRVRLLAGPGRGLRPRRPGRRHAPGRRRRARRTRLHLRAAAGAGLPAALPTATTRRPLPAGTAPGPAAPVLRRGHGAGRGGARPGGGRGAGAAGAEIVDVDLPHTDYGLATYYIIAPAEASANLARYDGIRFGPAVRGGDVLANYLATRDRGFGPEVKRRIMLGTYALSAGYYDAYYLKAQKVRTLIKGDFDRAFAHVDAIVAPTSPTVALPPGAHGWMTPSRCTSSDTCTLPVNVAGLPGMSVPCGLSDGLPVGLQLIGRPWDEVRLLALGRAWEAITAGADWRAGSRPTWRASTIRPATLRGRVVRAHASERSRAGRASFFLASKSAR